MPPPVVEVEPCNELGPGLQPDPVRYRGFRVLERNRGDHFVWNLLLARLHDPVGVADHFGAGGRHGIRSLEVEDIGPGLHVEERSIRASDKKPAESEVGLSQARAWRAGRGAGEIHRQEHTDPSGFRFRARLEDEASGPNIELGVGREVGRYGDEGGDELAARYARVLKVVDQVQLNETTKAELDRHPGYRYPARMVRFVCDPVPGISGERFGWRCHPLLVSLGGAPVRPLLLFGDLWAAWLRRCRSVLLLVVVGRLRYWGLLVTRGGLTTAAGFWSPAGGSTAGGSSAYAVVACHDRTANTQKTNALLVLNRRTNWFARIDIVEDLRVLHYHGSVHDHVRDPGGRQPPLLHR